MAPELREGTVEANGIEFAFLEAGTGPLALHLHGFPDNAWTWERQLSALADAGYRAVAPYLRGYAPTDVPAEGFDLEDVTHDVEALIHALGEDSAFVVGHDWGAFASMNVSAVHPGSVIRAISVGVGHPRTAVDIFKSPEQLHYAFHVWLFQLEGFAEFALRENDFALVDYLWSHWSSVDPDPEHLARVKKTFTEPGVVEAALSYYRGLVRIPSSKPDFYAQVTQNMTTPMLVIYGGDDPARALSENEGSFFDGPYRRELISGAGHFPHREAPEEFNRVMLEWIGSD
ncbi:MAG TPA: alpha/beta hydrolase [Actinomycetota bacterium]|nr:alpha/beta hydrolase [Actinomycetota bacterium]